MIQRPSDVPLFEDYDELMQWCRDAREGKIKVSPEARNYAKLITYGEYYGVAGKIGK